MTTGETGSSHKQELKMLAMSFAAKAVEDSEMAWGKKVSPAFKRKVIEISAELGIDPNNLMAAMAFESARTFRADIQNARSGAVGLIQFMPATAKGLRNIDGGPQENDASRPARFCETLFPAAEGKAAMTSTMYTWRSFGRAP